jgi:hypothetical protein
MELDNANVAYRKTFEDRGKSGHETIVPIRE